MEILWKSYILLPTKRSLTLAHCFAATPPDLPQLPHSRGDLLQGHGGLYFLALLLFEGHAYRNLRTHLVRTDSVLYKGLDLDVNPQVSHIFLPSAKPHGQHVVRGVRDEEEEGGISKKPVSPNPPGTFQVYIWL